MQNITVPYSEFKTIALSKDLKVQYVQVGGVYTILAFDGSFGLECRINPTYEPADAADFESVFLPTANEVIDTGEVEVTAVSAVENSTTANALTLNNTLQLDVSGMTTAAVEIRGTWSGNIEFAASMNGVDYFPIAGASLVLLDGQPYTNVSFNDTFIFGVTGMKYLRLEGATINTGTAEISMGANIGSNIITAIQGIVYVSQIGNWDINSSALPTGASTSAKQDTGNTALDAIKTATELIDDGVATVASASKTKGMTAIGHDGTNARILKTDSSGELQIDVLTLPTLPAGTNAIGKLSANSGVDIGDVDVTSLPALPAGSNNIGDVDVLTLPALTAGSAVIGKVGIDQTTPGTTNGVQINAALPAGTNAIGKLSANSGVDIGDVDVTSIAAGTNRLGSVRLVDSSDSDLTALKGTQTSRAVGVQHLHDSGRTELRYYAVAVAAGTTTTETAITLTKSSATSATSTGTSFVITNGKKFRITQISVATRGHSTATIQTTTFNLRVNTAGAVTTSSTPIVLAMRSATAAVASAWDRVIMNFPEGWEITGDGTLQFGITAAATYTTNAPTWDVLIQGYEY